MQQYGPAFNKLPSYARQALRDYTANDFEDLNKGLRGGKDLNAHKPAMVDQLDHALSEDQTSTDMTLAVGDERFVYPQDGQRELWRSTA